MTSNAFGLIYTGETNPFLRDLALSRSVAAVPFGGRYRCIDFILSDLVNTGVTSVGLITQKNYHSLMVWLPERMTYCCGQRRTYPRQERIASTLPR